MFTALDRTAATVPLLSPNVIELDTEHYRKAQALRQTSGDELQQWESYISALGLLALEDWLSENAPELNSQRLPQSAGAMRYLTLNGFRLGIITTEECLSDCATFPGQVIHDPEWAAHFYLLLEVAEEQEEVLFRGLLRHDTLVKQVSTTGEIILPLSAFEPELSRLMHYSRYLDPAAIPLPTAQTAATTPTITETIANASHQLSQWLDNIIAEGWQTIEALTNQPQMAYATRGLADGIKRGKLMNLGLDLDEQSVALVLTITPEADDKIKILIQLLPTGSERVLPAAINLALVSRSGKTIQQTTSRDRDSYIQLKAFRGNIGQQFTVTTQLGETTVSEAFEI
ncbi:DUF1822 family protein [filamentous cyanobacterium LEGE 11480]|uniref:DUF1822 family protein n=1 Tax=Romeriopsis navalis LEGE 11480 TaxID=2777977 RepID=A0A928Z5C3_9CYAN|nr:DUF1822 family protein [Romeriopsis navalis]MBE9032674.1 DUF1822 family protein [Romeriopsis navalis LEGE 11480]